MARPIDIQTPLGPKALLLLRLSVSEHLSRLAEIRIQVKSRRPDIAAEEMLGANVTLRIEMSDPGRPRYFNGYVTRWQGVTEILDASQGGGGDDGGRAYLYEATVHPWLWFLTRRADCRIFSRKTVPEIVKEVFAGTGGLASFEDRTTGRYPVREHCCQYRETDFNFVGRLLEAEGIYWWFTHENGKHTLVLADGNAQHAPFDDTYATLRFDHEDRPDAESLGHWMGEFEVQAGKVVLADYNPRTPRTDLTAAAAGARAHPYASFESFDYPAEYDSAEDGRHYAATRLDEYRTQYQAFRGGGSVRGLAAGCVFDLERHPFAAYNAKYLAVGVRIEATAPADASGGGAGGTLHAGVDAVPFRQQFRPPRVTPKPLIQGPQTATVVGPAGEEIYTDDPDHMACVKVQFRWDRYGRADENSSCWIRVATPWAGNAYGALAIPRVGQEVVVEFLEGDPDRPLVTGSVYNAVNLPPYALPGGMTRWGVKSRSSKGGGAGDFNELSFEDKMGSEEVYLHAQKDHNLYVRNDRKERILNESHRDVAKDVLEKLGADVHCDVAGDQIVRTGGGVHLTVGQDWQAKVTSKFAVDAAQEIHLKAGATIVLEASARISLKVGGSFIDINPGGVFIQGSMVMVNSGGSAGSGSGASPKTPKTAKQAADSQGGTDAPISQKAATLIAARASSTPFCEICNA
jgi:type VI secretion system secreted protein VgrG